MMYSVHYTHILVLRGYIVKHFELLSFFYDTLKQIYFKGSYGTCKICDFVHLCRLLVKYLTLLIQTY